MSCPVDLRLPDGMTVDRASKAMLIILADCLAGLIGAGMGRERLAVEGAKAATVVCGCLTAVRIANNDLDMPTEDMLLIAEMLDQFQEWMREEGEKRL